MLFQDAILEFGFDCKVYFLKEDKHEEMLLYQSCCPSNIPLPLPPLTTLHFPV